MRFLGPTKFGESALMSRKHFLCDAISFFIALQLPVVSAAKSLRNFSSTNFDRPFIFPQPERLVAIGDLHGDMHATREAFRLAGVLHPIRDDWIGGPTVVVQVGDQLDRGDGELEVLAFLHRLKKQAHAAGGALHILAGNHETLVADGDMRYASQGAFQPYDDWLSSCAHTSSVPASPVLDLCPLLPAGRLDCPIGDADCHAAADQLDPAQRARFLALRRGGPLARLLAAERQVVLLVGDSVFVHGGLSPDFLGAAREGDPSAALATLNAALATYFSGADPPAKAAAALDGLVWSRDYSAPSPEELAADGGADGGACGRLAATLRALPGRVRRMVVGHTPQSGGVVTAACDGAVWRVDVGMSRGVAGFPPQVLEIRPGGRLRVLSAPAAVGDFTDGGGESSNVGARREGRRRRH